MEHDTQLPHEISRMYHRMTLEWKDIFILSVIVLYN